MRAGLLLLALGLAGCGDPLAGVRTGVPEGRRAAALLTKAADADSTAAADLAAQASTVAISGLASSGLARDTEARLWHTLALARVRLAASGPADSAFAEALVRADAPRQRARYAYDAGTAALLAGEHAHAVGLLRRALALAPDHADARRNYEIARRRADAERPPEASAFAQAVKAQADSLVAARQYRDALDVLEDGLARDSSVAVYSDTMERLGGVVQIEERVPPGDVPAVDSSP